MSIYESTNVIKHYDETPLFKLSNYNKQYIEEYDYISDEYSELLEKLKDIIKKENIQKIKSFSNKIKFSLLQDAKIKAIDLNLERIIKSTLVTFAKEKTFDDGVYYNFDELDPAIIGDFCIRSKISFNTYLSYSSLIRRVFVSFIDNNYIFDDWGFYTLSKDKESIELWFHDDYRKDYISAKEKFIENAEDIVEEADF